MEPKILNKDSFIYKLLQWPGGFEVSSTPEDSCELITAVLLKIGCLAVILGCLILMSWIILTGPVSLIFPSWFHIKELEGHVVFSWAMWAFSLFGVCIHYFIKGANHLSNRRRESYYARLQNRRQLSQKFGKTREALKVMYRSWKDKVCIRIKFQ
jgi:hypothetical protein